MLPGKGIENLTDLNFQIAETISSVQPRRIVLEVLSDILLRHKALQTRKWLNEFLEKLRSKGITTLAILNPYMHAGEEVQAVVDLFDGNLEIIEKDAKGQLQKLLRINWMHGITVTDPEFLLELAAPKAPSRPEVKAAPANNLPVQSTPLIGREKELADALPLVLREDTRVLTLTGPGGTGKTALGLEVARNLLGSFRDGVFFVSLAPITDPSLLLSTLATTFAVKEEGGRPLIESLKNFLREKRLLLVLDNFEQIIKAAPQLSDLLTACAKLKLLVTSREPLRIRDEREFPVPPLAIPDLKHLPPIEALSQNAAVALFVERAHALKPDFELTQENARAVADICVRLDGLPLAVELASARIRILPPQTMLRRMGSRLGLLTSGARDLPARQRTLRNAIAWSHDLLDAQEQRLFRRLSIFVGGFTLEAAESVCNSDHDLEVLDGVSALVEKSLVRQVQVSRESRFSFLETIREFASECLAGSGELEAVRMNFVGFYLDLAERAYKERHEFWTEWLSKLEAEHENLRLALDLAGILRLRTQLQLAGAISWFWSQHSHLTEGRKRLTDSLEGYAGRDEFYARALDGAGNLAMQQGDHITARTHLEEALMIRRDLGDENEVALTLGDMGWSSFTEGDDQTALLRFEESLALLRKGGNKQLINQAILNVCQVLVSQGQVGKARPVANEALALGMSLNDLRAQQSAHHFLADCSLIGEDCTAAYENYSSALRLAVEFGDMFQATIEMHGVAMGLAGMSQFERALRLDGAATAYRQELGGEFSVPFWDALLTKYLGQAKEQLGPKASAAAWEEGKRMGFQGAVAYALNPEER
jgi:predicted ATPase